MTNNTTITNEYAIAIIDNRWMGKTQLTADDLGAGKVWKQYRQLCDNIVIAAYDSLTGKGKDANTLGITITALFNFFEVDCKATPEYQNRLVASTIMRKPHRSDALKNANKAKRAAKAKWEDAILDEKSETEIADLKTAYDEATATVEALMAEPHNFWYDLEPMLDKTKKHATPAGRKAIEDCIADIINQRAMMTAEELQAEAQRLADERKGRAIRKKNEAKAEANAK